MVGRSRVSKGNRRIRRGRVRGKGGEGVSESSAGQFQQFQMAEGGQMR